MGAYNVDAVAARAQSLSDRVNACRERLDAEYAEKKRALDAFTIDGTSTAEQYFTQEEQLKKFGARLVQNAESGPLAGKRAKYVRCRRGRP